jgi:hypothetical protein
MDDLVEAKTISSSRLPRAVVPVTQLEEAAAEKRDADSDPISRNPVFDQLVPNDRDLVGLVAYSLYKLSKRDWIEAFREEQHRYPTAAEVNVYITGEKTQRRLATYRRLAEDALALRPSPLPTDNQAGSVALSGAQTGVMQNDPAKLKGLFIRLGLLAAAVVIVGLALRFLLVR